MSETKSLIELLARPGVHSGTELGEQLGISRVAIKKRIDRLETEGFPVESVAGRGYRIREGVELLCAEKIRQSSGIENLQIEIFQELGSTNQYLSSQPVDIGIFKVAVAESQPSGQGRRGRTWVASPYQNIMLSIGYTFPTWPENPAGISLAFSVAVHSALVSLGVENLSLKWPNDLMVRKAKLGGLLVSASGEAGGALSMVLGVGINVRLDLEDAQSVDQAVVDLCGLGYTSVSRNHLIGEIVKNSAEMLEIYPESGFAPFAEYWNREAEYLHERVRLIEQDTEYRGRLLGVDSEGYLQLETDSGKVQRFNSSDLSLRPLNK